MRGETADSYIYITMQAGQDILPAAFYERFLNRPDIDAAIEAGRLRARMINDILNRPCDRCGEHRERIRSIRGRLAQWWQIKCAWRLAMDRRRQLGALSPRRHAA